MTFKKLKFLVAEDNKMNVLIIKKFLEKQGVEIDVAENGEKAIQLAIQNTYDLILMDLQMPLLDGYQAARKIRESLKNVPIIAITATAFLDVKKEVHDYGMNDYVTKPFSEAELLEVIKRHVKEIR